MTERQRGVSPVVGVLLVLAITLLLASMISYQFSALGTGLDAKRSQYDEAVTTLSGNPWSGEPGDLVRISNSEAGATDVRYRVNFRIEPGSPAIGSNAKYIALEVTTGSPDMFSNTELSDLYVAGVDEDDDGTIDYSLTTEVNAWEVKDGGTSLKIDLDDTAYTASENDTIIVEFDGVDNPQNPGEYELRAETGYGNWHEGTITIVE